MEEYTPTATELSLSDEATQVPIPIVVVKFEIPDVGSFTLSFTIDHTVFEVKQRLAKLLTIPYETIVVLHDDIEVPDCYRLETLIPDKFGILKLKAFCSDDRYVVDLRHIYGEELPTPDILTVLVVTADGEEKEVVVEMLNRAIQKPLLGGYRNIRTGVKYFHGYSQTGPPPPKVPPWKKNHRDTQTYFMRNRKTEKEYSRATQMARCDLYIPSLSDVIITAGPYETAEEREKRLDIEGKVRTIQRYYRAWKLMKCIRELAAEYRKRVRLWREREEREQKEDEDRRKRDIISKVFPLTHADFAMLHTMVERWKTAEIARISATYCGAPKIAELYLVLEKEIELLRCIQSIRNKVAKDQEVKKTVDFFKAIGVPIDWYSDYKNLHIFMDTLETQRGRELFAIYKELADKSLGKEEKLEAYLKVKEYLFTHDCEERKDIISLIDRACELIVRGLDDKYLETLQMRIETMVVRHFQNVECNEGVTYHMKKVRQKNMLKNLVYCHRCQKLKTIDKYTLNARMDSVTVCTNCRWVDKSEEPWIDLSPYRFILKQIRNFERLHKAKSSVAFILQDRDIHFIITKIWHGHSALSECTELYEMRLVRWRIQEEWSPWNCILLTKAEAKAHLEISHFDLETLEDVYEKEFFNHVFNKHALARQHFANLTAFDRHFTEFAKGDDKLDDDSDFYNKPVIECMFGPIPSTVSVGEEGDEEESVYPYFYDDERQDMSSATDV